MPSRLISQCWVLRHGPCSTGGGQRHPNPQDQVPQTFQESPTPFPPHHTQQPSLGWASFLPFRTPNFSTPGSKPYSYWQTKPHHFPESIQDSSLSKSMSINP